jgi:hypothetical protein
MEKLKQGTLVEYEIQTLKGRGIIVGMALDDITQSYIIQPEISVKSKTYPYTHFICPVGHLKLVHENFHTPEDRKDSPHHYTNRLD